MTTGQHILIEIGHQVARVTPGKVRQLLAGDLAYTVTEFQSGGPLGYRRQSGGKILHRRHEDALFVPAGLANQVANKLRTCGYEVTVRDLRRYSHKTTPHLEALAEWVGHWQEQDFMRAVGHQPRGLIEVRGAAELAEKLAHVCRLFPLANVMVAWNAGGRKLAALRSKIQQAAPLQAFRLVDEYAWPYEGGRLVCSLQDFAMHNGIDFDVVIFVDAQQTLSPGGGEGLGRMRFQRVYAFTAPNNPISEKSLLRLHANIGPYVWPSPDLRCKEPKVRVEWCMPPWSSAPGRGAALVRKRLGYWRNDRRNDFIAGVARALAAGDVMFFQGGAITKQNGDANGHAPGSPAVFTILVETTEHGRELLRRLPGWRMIDDIQPRQQHTDLFGSSWTLDRAVVTYAAAMKRGGVDADVLIAAGGEDAMALDCFPVQRHRSQSEVLLVDVADDFDAMAREAARRRMRDYTARGWAAVSVPAWMREVSDGGNYAATRRPWAADSDD